MNVPAYVKRSSAKLCSPDKVSDSGAKWRTVRNWLELQIESGAIRNGERLPSLRILAKQFRVSLATVQRALADLETTAAIRAVARKGYFASVAEGHSPAHDFSGVKARVDLDVVAMLASAASTGIVPLGSAVLDESLVPNALLKRCMGAIARQSYGSFPLYPPPGALELRKRIAGLMIERGVICTANDIVITGGDTVAMELSLRAMGRPGEQVIVEDPTYFGILQTIEQTGMRAVPIRTNPVSGIDLDHLSFALRSGPHAAIFLNPTLHNPLGFVMPESNRRALATLAQVSDVGIIEDDVFFDLLPESGRVRAIKFFGARTYCIVLRSQRRSPQGCGLAGAYRHATRPGCSLRCSAGIFPPRACRSSC